MPMSPGFKERLCPHLPAIAQQFGTPFHIYDEVGIRETGRALKAAFAGIPVFREYYAVKALPNPSVLRLMREMGFGFDCSSITELMLARDIGAHGLHLSSKRLMATTERPTFARVAATCHAAEELAHAASLGLDFAVLGPVLPTASHPESRGLGWTAFGELIEKSPIPVFALGGMSGDLLETARRAGAHGIAMLRGW